MRSTSHFDVIVCGAGPAGSSCAIFLAKAGKKVLLLDKAKFPRDKICADNKSWICTSIVKELGLWEKFQKLPKCEITNMLFSTPGGVEFPIELDTQKIKSDGPHYNVRRMVFDDFLFQAAKKNKKITIMEQFQVENVIFDSKNNGHSKKNENSKNKENFVIGVRGKDAKGKEQIFFSSVVVAADGSQSMTSRSAGFEPVNPKRYALSARAYYSGVDFFPNTVELHYLKGVCPGYFWIFPVDKGWCNVGVGVPTEQLKKKNLKIDDLLEEIIASPRFARRFKKAKRVSGVGLWGISIGGPNRKRCADGIVLVGDAGHTAVTFAGEGVGPAMRSGKIAAQTIAKAFDKNDFSANTLSHYEHELWKTIGPENESMFWMEFLATHPRLFDWAVKRGKKNSYIKKLVTSIGSDYKNAKRIVHPQTVFELLKG